MKQIKSLGIVFLIIIIILVLVVARTSNKNLFKQNPKNATENCNSISINYVNKLSNNYLVVNLGSSDNFDSSQFTNAVNISFENILEKNNQDILKEAEGEILLYSEDISMAAKAYVILNQLGFKKVLILEKEENEEVFKYKFQPDTTAKLE